MMRPTAALLVVYFFLLFRTGFWLPTLDVYYLSIFLLIFFSCFVYHFVFGGFRFSQSPAIVNV